MVLAKFSIQGIRLFKLTSSFLFQQELVNLNKTYIIPIHLNMSLRLATIISRNKTPMPMYSAQIIKFSLGLRRVIISYSKNSTCPPSRAGMGKMFMKARMMLRKAVMSQNMCQSHTGGNMLPMAPKPPSDLAPSVENRYLRSPT